MGEAMFGSKLEKRFRALDPEDAEKGSPLVDLHDSERTYPAMWKDDREGFREALNAATDKLVDERDPGAAIYLLSVVLEAEDNLTFSRWLRSCLVIRAWYHFGEIALLMEHLRTEKGLDKSVRQAINHRVNVHALEAARLLFDLTSFDKVATIRADLLTLKDYEWRWMRRLYFRRACKAFQRKYKKTYLSTNSDKEIA